MTWTPGQDRIQVLLAAGEPGLDADDFAGAYQLAYDALRKSAASLLAVRGLRATTREDVLDALPTAATARDAAITILAQNVLEPW